MQQDVCGRRVARVVGSPPREYRTKRRRSPAGRSGSLRSCLAASKHLRDLLTAGRPPAKANPERERLLTLEEIEAALGRANVGSRSVLPVHCGSYTALKRKHAG